MLSKAALHCTLPDFLSDKVMHFSGDGNEYQVHKIARLCSNDVSKWAKQKTSKCIPLACVTRSELFD